MKPVERKGSMRSARQLRFFCFKTKELGLPRRLGLDWSSASLHTHMQTTAV
jgi:hypothetical protein